MAFTGVVPEAANGRIAMLGFVAAMGAELNGAGACGQLQRHRATALGRAGRVAKQPLAAPGVKPATNVLWRGRKRSCQRSASASAADLAPSVERRLTRPTSLRHGD